MRVLSLRLLKILPIPCDAFYDGECYIVLSPNLTIITDMPYILFHGRSESSIFTAEELHILIKQTIKAIETKDKPGTFYKCQQRLDLSSNSRQKLALMRHAYTK